MSLKGVEYLRMIFMIENFYFQTFRKFCLKVVLVKIAKKILSVTQILCGKLPV